MSTHRVWKRLLGVEHAVIEAVDVEADEGAEMVVARVRPTRSRQGRCSRCGRRASRYDQGSGRRRWRAIDLGTVMVELEADAPRVRTEKITAGHLDRTGLVYIRQSSRAQVRNNAESIARQYALADEAVRLGCAIWAGSKKRS